MGECFSIQDKQNYHGEGEEVVAFLVIVIKYPDKSNEWEEGIHFQS